MNVHPLQISLFAEVAGAYAASPCGVLDNESLYATVADRIGTTRDAMDMRTPIGRAGVPRSTAKRKIRWYQQTLKQLGVIEHVPGERGVWRLSENAGKDLHRAAAGATSLSAAMPAAIPRHTGDMPSPWGCRPMAPCSLPAFQTFSFGYSLNRMSWWWIRSGAR